MDRRMSAGRTTHGRKLLKNKKFLYFLGQKCNLIAFLKAFFVNQGSRTCFRLVFLEFLTKNVIDLKHPQILVTCMRTKWGLL